MINFIRFILTCFLIFYFLYFCFLLYHHIKYPIGKETAGQEIRVVNLFGLPGCGKTTVLCYLAIWYLKRGVPVFSNVAVNIEGVNVIDNPRDLGKYRFYGPCVFLNDEASTDFNNRKFKSFSSEMIYWWKRHRHDKCIVYNFSQAPEDVDLTIRNLEAEVWHIRKFMGYFAFMRRVKKTMGVYTNSNSNGVQHGEFMSSVVYANIFEPNAFKFIYMPRYWQFSDSYEMAALPQIPFHTMHNDNMPKWALPPQPKKKKKKKKSI